jgi:Flp pilus assembly pilin Flp
MSSPKRTEEMPLSLECSSTALIPQGGGRNDSMIDTFKRLHRDDNGQDLVEYALIICLMGLGPVATMKTLANHIASSFTTVGSTLVSAV